MTVSIEQEPLSEGIFAEIMPLAQQCWNESTLDKAETCAFYGERDFAVEPDLAAYERLDKAGQLIVVTLRNNGVLNGFVIGIIYTSLHHKKILCGNGDSIYINPEYRSYADVVCEKFEQILTAKGVNIIGWPVHIDGSMYQVLKGRKYTADDTVMEKRLCVS